jgi:amino acid transporter
MRNSPSLRQLATQLGGALAFMLPCAAQASFLSGDALDTAASVMAWVVMIFVPIGAIVLFWIIHVLPEKIAHKRHHPQRDAIKVLCMLSLFFGGLLWPIAWLWAYTRPTSYKLAYGTEKHDDYYVEMGNKARAAELVDHEIAHLRAELDAMAAKGHLPPELRKLRQELDTLPQPPATAANASPAEGSA